MTLTVRPQLWKDLEETVAWLTERASPRVAERWHAAAKAAIKRVSAAPGAGHFRRDIPVPDMRVLPLKEFPSYLLFYVWDEDADAVTVYTIRYGGMNLPPLFAA